MLFECPQTDADANLHLVEDTHTSCSSCELHVCNECQLQVAIFCFHWNRTSFFLALQRQHVKWCWGNPEFLLCGRKMCDCVLADMDAYRYISADAEANLQTQTDVDTKCLCPDISCPCWSNSRQDKASVSSNLRRWWTASFHKQMLMCPATDELTWWSNAQWQNLLMMAFYYYILLCGQLAKRCGDELSLVISLQEYMNFHSNLPASFVCGLFSSIQNPDMTTFTHVPSSDRSSLACNFTPSVLHSLCLIRLNSCLKWFSVCIAMYLLNGY